MSANISFPLLLLVIFAFCLSGNGVHAFGAGNIPSFAYMEGRAFRHGDIEDVLAELIKRGAGGGFALASILSKGHKFNGLDIKRVYFGNWLRDYSQAVDIASLKKLPLQTIINLCMALGFMAHGYATGEFEVTEERLGVYLPTEHIDNPKGYGEGEDARKYHPKLRGPVDPMELQIDNRTGMKNYIANESGHWDTSKALVRRTLERCIHIGRQHRTSGLKQDEYESFRLLGQALHTLEDFSAHSNFCELALLSMGHKDIFPHVGDQVRIQSPSGQWVAPIVTGSFGSSDFIHSLLGEATDHLSSASVTDLNKELDNARSKSLQTTRGGGGGGPGDTLKGLLFTLPGSEGGEMTRDMEAIERIRAGPAQGGKKPEDMSPQELHAVLWQVLTFRDSVVKKISMTIEKIPGLGPLIEKIMDSISVFVFTTLEPFLKPILKTATSGLQAASGEVIDNGDQYEVFNDPRASDPTHSFLSKDHFNLILNEPAGKLARIVVIHTVNLVTKAWDDTAQNVHQVTDDVLQCLFHPDFHNNNSKIQREMMQCMRDWVQNLGAHQHKTLQRLGKNSVRNHENIRLAGDGGAAASQGSFAETEAHQLQHSIQGYAANIPGFSQAQSLLGGGANFPKREGGGTGGAPGYPGAPQGHANASAPPSMTGQAASYYGGSEQQQQGGQQPQGGRPGYPGSQPVHGQQQHGASSYGPPSGPPPGSGSSSYGAPSGPPHGTGSSSYGAPPGPPYGGGSSSYGPPSGAPPGSGSSFPSTPSGPQGPHKSGYTPSYSSPPPSFPGGASSPPPSFPGSAPSFPGSTPSFPGAPPSFHGGPSPPPSFPGAGPSFPGSGPSFPGSGPSFPGGPDNGPGGGYGGGYGGPPGSPGGPGFPGGGPGFPGAAPGFPGADPYGQQPPQFPGGPGHGHHGGQPGYPGYGHQQHGQGGGGGW